MGGSKMNVVALNIYLNLFFWPGMPWQLGNIPLPLYTTPPRGGTGVPSLQNLYGHKTNPKRIFWAFFGDL